MMLCLVWSFRNIAFLAIITPKELTVVYPVLIVGKWPEKWYRDHRLIYSRYVHVAGVHAKRCWKISMYCGDVYIEHTASQEYMW